METRLSINFYFTLTGKTFSLYSKLTTTTLTEGRADKSSFKSVMLLGSAAAKSIWIKENNFF